MNIRKLNLSVDDLAVESFETVEKEAEEQGTVFGHGASDSTCIQRICTCTNGMNTACDYTCATCINECATDAGCFTQVGYPGC